MIIIFIFADNLTTESQPICWHTGIRLILYQPPLFKNAFFSILESLRLLMKTKTTLVLNHSWPHFKNKWLVCMNTQQPGHVWVLTFNKRTDMSLQTFLVENCVSSSLNADLWPHWLHTLYEWHYNHDTVVVGMVSWKIFSATRISEGLGSNC